MIIYDGPSLLNGDRIVGIVTGIDKPSQNRKTGPMAQLYILSGRSHPTKALKNGRDEAICGDCKHRPENLGSCYVVVAQGPSAIYRAWRAGSYCKASAEEVNARLQALKKPLRLGAYGDPAALPLNLLSTLTKGIKFTGYTHQWKTCDPAYREFTMASVDTPEEWAQAKNAGWRTFRVRTADEVLAPYEIACPASDEMGHKTTCDHCVLCMGTRVKAKDIAIIVHGQHTRPFIQLTKRSDYEPAEVWSDYQR